MPFINKMKPKKYPSRLWALSGEPGTGKSTFAARMRGSLLVIDADQRWDEVLKLNSDVYPLSDNPADNTNPYRIRDILEKEMPGSHIGTFIIDSLTTIIAPLVTKAIADKRAGEIKSLGAGFLDKALAMRMLQDSITKWGADTLWIYHTGMAGDEKGNQSKRPTISRTELARLTRSINAFLETVVEKDRRGIKIVWCRQGRSNRVVWDDEGKWLNMPEKLEAAMYDGLTEADQQAIANAIPQEFADDAAAIAWGLEKGAFKALQHSRNALDKLVSEKHPKDARELAHLWTEEVLARVAAHDQNGLHDDEPTDHEQGGAEQAGPTPYVVGPTEFWKEVGRKKYPRANAQQIVDAYTVAGKTDWVNALVELQSK